MIPSGPLEGKDDTLLPLVEHAIAYILKVGVVLDVGSEFLGGVGHRAMDAFEYFSDAGRRASDTRFAQALKFFRTRP